MANRIHAPYELRRSASSLAICVSASTRKRHNERQTNSATFSNREAVPLLVVGDARTNGQPWWSATVLRSFSAYSVLPLSGCTDQRQRAGIVITIHG